MKLSVVNPLVVWSVESRMQIFYFLLLLLGALLTVNAALDSKFNNFYWILYEYTVTLKEVHRLPILRLNYNIKGF